MKVFGIVGRKNSGKTHLVTRLLRLASRRGLRVSTIKHAHHSFDIDRPGKDSHLQREAGAHEVLVEGFEREVDLRLEVYRASCGQTPLAFDDQGILALATDEAATFAVRSDLPCLPLDDEAAVLDYVLARA
ncbi:MAG: molybdopterin-guanine dinucleotide biosynthesis protein B [Steroidobacteraceae bacterium]|nr:molybdopterin-guanine dinucleotide biosynthesis protein B [Pseudomonadota bacterium]MBP6107536.1 molybdopterin-guanine dinucleotide biosynthesis protein B [Steroidobacteraceae bacterium]MBP7014834.1 molybdopterin-guanine dinucleotide biosynthesis protein B [Steroidobacteraceae bacterium]